MRHVAFSESEAPPLSPGEFQEVMNLIFSDPSEDPTPSLYDLFDIDTDTGLLDGGIPDPDHFPASSALAAAANAIFSDSILDQCFTDQTEDTDAVSRPLNTPDLVCTEVVPDSPDFDAPAEVSNKSASEAKVLDSAPEFQCDYELDCPEVPGVDCKSCEFHKKKAAAGDIKCSLCYMRLTSFFVYSKYIYICCNYFI